jgi:hypothetical protein
MSEERLIRYSPPNETLIKTHQIFRFLTLCTKGAYAIDEMKKRCGVYVLKRYIFEKGAVWQQNYM